MKAARSAKIALEKVRSKYDPTYAQDKFERNYWRHLWNLRSCVQYAPPGARVLDLGCGMAVVPRALLELGYEVVLLSHVGGPSWATEVGISCLKCDLVLESIPSQSSQFDLVTYFATLEHLHGSPKNMLQEAVRVLKPSGHLLLDTPNGVDLRKTVRVLFGWRGHPFALKDFYDAPLPYDGHVREYTAREVRQVLEWNGFEVVHVATKLLEAIPTEIGPKTWTRKFRLVRFRDFLRLGYILIGMVIPRFRDTIVACARKPNS